MHFLVKSQHLFDVVSRTTVAGILEIQAGKIVARHTTIPAYLSQLPLYDMGDQLVLPGFIDAHVHYYLSVLVHAGFLGKVGGENEAIVAAQAATLPVTHGWKIGIGWYASDFGQQTYPTKASLDRYTGDTPTVLIAGDAHSIWLNSAAMARLEINEVTLPATITGERLRHNGELTGVFLEAIAIYYLAEILQLFKAQFAPAHHRYMQYLNTMGISAVGDVALTGESPDDMVYPALYANQTPDPTVRISVYPAMRQETRHIEQLMTHYHTPFLQVGGVKQFFDGVTSSHTAYLKQEYPAPYFKGDVGGPLIPLETQYALVQLAAEKGWPMRIHAIGDRAIQLTLEYFKAGQEKWPLGEGKYNTIEHLEVMDLADVELTTQPNLVLSVQPSHLLVGYETLEEELGAERVSTMFPFQTFIDYGATLAFGTDSPVVLNVTPLESIYYAVARQTTSGLPTPPLMPDQQMTIADAIVAHTLGAAKALSRTDIGTLDPGMWADLVVLSQNIMDVTQPSDLLATQVVATFVAGKCVYRAESTP